MELGFPAAAKAPASGVMLTNARSGQVIARGVELALTRSARRKGLLGRSSLASDTALVLAPCLAVHTAFMRFPIDVVFVDRAGIVKRIVRRLPPWRMAAVRGAYATIELAAGALDSHDLAVGDRLCLGMTMSMKLGGDQARPQAAPSPWSLWRVFGRMRAHARSASGVAVLELAIAAPLLLLMALGAGDFGRVLYTSIILSHAARAGAQYGAQNNATTADTAGIRQAAELEGQDVAPLTVTSARICECPSGAVVSCTTATCPGYGVPQVFVEVTATKTFQTLVPYPLIPNNVPLSRTAKVRRQ